MIRLRAVKNNRKIGWIKYKYLSNARTFLRLLVKKKNKNLQRRHFKKASYFSSARAYHQTAESENTQTRQTQGKKLKQKLCKMSGIVKLNDVVFCNSEHPRHKVQNLRTGAGKWTGSLKHEVYIK